MTQNEVTELACPYCKQNAPLTADECPHCGHEFSDLELKMRRAVNDRNPAALIGCAALALVIVFGVYYCSTNVSFRGGSSSAKNCFSAWDGSHRKLVSRTKSNLRDPDSFEHIETRADTPAAGSQTVIMKYRARNGFGGMNVEYATGTINPDTCDLL